MTSREMSAANAAPHRADGVPPVVPPPLDGLTVLLVDDDARVGEMMAEMLKCCGAEVTTVGSVGEALRLMPDMRPDLLLSDLSMPGRDGFALIQAVRALTPERGGRVPAVAVSGDTDGRTRQRAKTAGFDHYLEKPVDLRRLVVAVEGMAMRGMRP